MITYLPHQLGYFADKFEIIRAALGSMIANTEPENDILVFDNGSSAALTDYLNLLLEEGSIRYLVLTDENIGKIAALRMLTGMAPGDYIACADDDILFYPGWLPAHMRIFEAFPQAGMVSGVPVRNAATYALDALHAVETSGRNRYRLKRGRFIPDEWEIDWCISTGRDPQQHLQAQAGREDLQLEASEVRALAGANHFQFLASKQSLLKALPKEWSGRLMGEMVEMDENLDRLGYLRLSTTDRYTRHIGNVLTQTIREDIQRMNLPVAPAPHTNYGRRKKHWLHNVRGSGRVLRWLYDRLFRIINEIGD